MMSVMKNNRQGRVHSCLFMQELSVITSGFGKENSVWEDFAFLVMNSFESCKKSSRVLNLQVSILVLLMQMSSSAANLAEDKHKWVRV